MRIEKVGVVGCGLMGSGIAQVAAQAGCHVVVREVSQAALDKGLASIDKNLQRMVDKGTLTAADRDAARGRLKSTTALADLKDSDLVVEAIIEQLPVKKDLWNELDALCPKHTVFASNTSVALNHRNVHLHQAPGPFSGPPLFQSRPNHEAR